MLKKEEDLSSQAKQIQAEPKRATLKKEGEFLFGS